MRLHFRREAILLALCSLLASSSFALDPDRLITQYIHNIWTVDQGLPHNVTTAIAQTPDGYLWVTTQSGLARFDGVRFTVFDKNNTPAITHDYLLSLCTDRDSSLWIGSLEGGLVHYKDGAFTNYTTKDGL